MSEYKLFHGDCLDVMPALEDASIDAVICDPPYGMTACKWDSVIPLEPMWEQIMRVLKPRGACVLFGSQPFTSALIMSNVEWFKYSLVWDKVLSSGFLNTNKMPLIRHEDVIIFGDGMITYNPQMTERDKPRIRTNQHATVWGDTSDSPYGVRSRPASHDTHRHPTTIVSMSKAQRIGLFHPTQKPLPLLEYLVKTYTNPGETVLDFCYGSGTTGHACANLERSFVGIEKDDRYFAAGENRIASAYEPLRAMQQEARG
jgi:DNA modification methylase